MLPEFTNSMGAWTYSTMNLSRNARFYHQNTLSVRRGFENQLNF